MDEQRTFAEALGGEIVGQRQDDGTWLCECGKSCPTDMALYMHRRHEHPVEPRALSMSDLFPPKGHLYLTEDRLEALRGEAVKGHAMVIPALTVLELISDWRNMQMAELERPVPIPDPVPSEDEIQTSLDEYVWLTDRQGELLTQTANALKGEPGPLSLHDWSDLPIWAAVFRQLVMEAASVGKIGAAMLTMSPAERDVVQKAFGTTPE